MFWVYLLIAVAAFLAFIGWATRRRGSATGMPTADLDGNVRRVRGRAEGGTATQGFANGKDSGHGVGGL